MKGYILDIETETLKNEDYRRVLYTGKNSQLVLMSIKPGDSIGEEVHHLDQFIRIEAGNGKAIMDGVEHDLCTGHAIVVPAGMCHNVINTSDVDLRLYTVYSPPGHKDRIVEHTKEDEIEEHFDGRTTE